MDEQKIIEKLQGGDENAFRELVNNYQKMVVNICFGMIHIQEDAEDIAQEVFIEVFRSIQKFRFDSKLSTWIYRISVNKSLNFIRDTKKSRLIQNIETVFSGKKENTETVADGDSQPGYSLENIQRAKIVHDAINELPKNQKTAFTLSKYEDLSYQEISEIMQVSLSSVESLVHRAKTNLQKKLYECYKKNCL